MGEVLLGMPGPWADDNSEEADHYTTKMGGLPDWPFPNSIIKPDLLKCDSCGEKLCLVAQIYAPISSITMTTEERVIYIFTCIATSCKTTSWRALRVQKSPNDNQPNPSSSHNSSSSSSSPTTKLQDDPWSFDDDEEEDDEIDIDNLCKALTEATTLASASKTKKQNTSSNPIDKSSPKSIPRPIGDKTPVLPCFYVYTQEENYVEDAAAFYQNEPLPDINEIQNEGGNDETWEGESYEYDRAINADRTYLKFKKRLDVNPEQCFRYSYGGEPILASSEAGGDPGKCMMCGELRHYEMQLMSPLLYFLQKATKNQALEKWNWLSVIVYTCSMGCAPSVKQEYDGWVVAEEAVVIQTE